MHGLSASGTHIHTPSLFSSAPRRVAQRFHHTRSRQDRSKLEWEDLVLPGTRHGQSSCTAHCRQAARVGRMNHGQSHATSRYITYIRQAVPMRRGLSGAGAFVSSGRRLLDKRSRIRSSIPRDSSPDHRRPVSQSRSRRLAATRIGSATVELSRLCTALISTTFNSVLPAPNTRISTSSRPRLRPSPACCPCF